jgi:hypothetical protein
VGFREFCSVDLNLIKVFGKAWDISRIQKNKKSYLLFIDLENAFCSVPHDKLFEKMKLYGFKEEIINSVKFLYNTSYTQIDSQPPISVNIGVAQGSILSPLLFNLYIDNLV